VGVSLCLSLGTPKSTATMRGTPQVNKTEEMEDSVRADQRAAHFVIFQTLPIGMYRSIFFNDM